MDANQRKSTGRLEINDLIDDAVNNAVERRNLGTDSEEALSALSYEEAASVAGGLTTATVAGFKPVCPPIIIGLIAVDPPKQQTS